MNQTLEHYLRCFCADNPVAWARLLPTAQFACNNAKSATTGLSPNEALMGYHPEFRLRVGDDALEGGVPDAKARVEKLEQLRQRLRKNWQAAAERQARGYNLRHQEKTLKRGDLVGLATKHLRFKAEQRKLAPRFIGPFRVLDRIGSQAYRLALPGKYAQIHNVFHISRLEPWHQREGPQDMDQQLLMPDLEENEEEWEVESIQGQRVRKRQQQYLVKWKGWPAEYNQWVSAEDMANSTELVIAFHKAGKKRARDARTTSTGQAQDGQRRKRGRPPKKSMKLP